MKNKFTKEFENVLNLLLKKGSLNPTLLIEYTQFDNKVNKTRINLPGFGFGDKRELFSLIGVLVAGVVRLGFIEKINFISFYFEGTAFKGDSSSKGEIENMRKNDFDYEAFKKKAKKEDVVAMIFTEKKGESYLFSRRLQITQVKDKRYFNLDKGKDEMNCSMKKQTGDENNIMGFYNGFKFVMDKEMTDKDKELMALNIKEINDSEDKDFIYNKIEKFIKMGVEVISLLPTIRK